MTGFDLRRLIEPASIAVVGATDRRGSYAAQALLNLETIGFEGEVWGVNPSRTEALGRVCVPTIADLPEPVDAVIVAIPAAGVPDVIDQAGERGCGGAVVLSAGFAEVADGAPLEQELVAAASRHRLPVCGPNCNGIVAMHARSALWGDELDRRGPGRVALVSQSGNVAVNALTARRGLRFHTVIASGNQAVIGAADFVRFLAGQPDLGAIALYLEDDGGPELCEGLAACAEAGVRVVVLKVGSSPAGARAAGAHSAALAGDQRVFRSLIEEAGAIWAEDLHELLELAKMAAVRTPPVGRGGLAIMTCSGGDSAQGADEAQRRGLALEPFAADSVARLRELLPAAATVGNPLDYTTMIWGERDALSELVSIVASDPAIGQLLVFYDQPADLRDAGEESWRAVREGLIAGAARSPVPVIVSSTLPELLDDDAAWRFAQAGVPAIAGLRTGLACAAAMRRAPGDPERLRAIAAAAADPDASVDEREEWLAEHEAKELLRANGIDVVPGRVAHDEDDAVAAFVELEGGVAMKLSSPSLQHKSELSAVELGLDSEPAVRAAYRRLSSLDLGSVLVERMADPGVELLIAAHRDGIVPALVIGLGGAWTELVDDVAVVPLPAGPERIELELRALRGASLLTGGRGRPPLDLGAAARLAAAVGTLLLEQFLALLELNPVLVGETGAVAVDATARRAARARTTEPAGSPVG